MVTAMQKKPRTAGGGDIAQRMARRRRSVCSGFTLIELLVVLAIVAMLLTLTAPKYFGSLDTANEVVLIDNLKQTREVIDKYYADTGQYPDSLAQLVDRNYLRDLPVDPYTESSQTWIIIAPEPAIKGKVFNIRSGANGTTRNGRRLGDL